MRRRRTLAVGVLCSFGLGWAAGALSHHLLWPAPEPRRIAGRDPAVLPADGVVAPVSPRAASRTPSAPPMAVVATDGHDATLPLSVAALKGTDGLRPPLGPPAAVAATRLDAARTAPPGATGARPMVASLTRMAEFGTEARLTKAVLPRAPRPEVAEIEVRRGDTLMDILMRAGIDAADAHAAVASLRELYDPRRLRAGQSLAITTAEPKGDDGIRLVGLALPVDLDHEIRVSPAGGGFVAARFDRPQERRLVRRSGTIRDSLYLSAERAAVPQDVLIDLIRTFSWDVDFQRDIRRGDGFETLFEEVSLADGGDTRVRGGDVLYARLTLSGEDIEAFRFDHADGSVAYYDRTGRSLRKFLLRTPIDGARMSSGFGMRRHPILGYSRMHKGTDFAAPTGTPVFAAGDGKVEVAKRYGSYGNYIKLHHNGEYSTAYAHLSSFAKGIGPGRPVRQGQVIGYVGTTGRSTGPHLHYEVIRHGEQINPMTIEQPPNVQLAGAELATFEHQVARVDQLRASLDRGPQLASRFD